MSGSKGLTQRNIAVLVALVVFIAIIYAVTVIRIKQGIYQRLESEQAPVTEQHVPTETVTIGHGEKAPTDAAQDKTSMPEEPETEMAE